jgi:Xaa-Pro aminopeptidase
MEPDLSKLDEFLAERGVDGYLINTDGEDSDQRYLSGFAAPDPYTTLYADGGVHLLVSSLEFGRAKRESRAETVRRLADYDYRDLLEDHDPEEATTRVLADWLADQCGREPPEKRTVTERLAAGDLSDPAERRLRTSKRVGNDRLHELGYEFAYPTFREGYRAAVEARREG